MPRSSTYGTRTALAYSYQNEAFPSRLPLAQLTPENTQRGQAMPEELQGTLVPVGAFRLSPSRQTSEQTFALGGAASLPGSAKLYRSVHLVLDNVELTEAGKGGGYYYRLVLNVPVADGASNKPSAIHIGTLGAFKINGAAHHGGPVQLRYRITRAAFARAASFSRVDFMSNESVLIEANRPTVSQPPDRAAPEGEVSIACYDSVSPSLEAELQQLYHHINSSFCHHAVARRAQDAFAYVARRGEHPLAIFLFQHEGRSIMVFNEMMQIPPEEIERFADYIFSRFPSVARISFSKIGKDIGTLSRPWQQYGDAEDIVASLPETVDAYLSRLGPKTRYNIRHQMKAIAADFPGFRFETYENDAIAERHVTGLIDLKKANMNEKRIKFGITPGEASWMAELAKTRGLLVLALLDGQVCGGSLSFRLGDHYFALLNGYDTRFAKYSLGMLCCYLAMTEKIQRGATEAHLLWGRNQYKFRLLGVARNIANLDIYRSRLAYCRHSKRVVRNALDNLVQQQKWMLLENEQRRGFLPSLLGRIVKILRRIKRSNFRPAS